MQDDTDRASHRRRSGRGKLLIVCSAILLVGAAGVVTGLAWTRPSSARLEAPYVQTAKIRYAAATPPGSLYGKAGVTTGEPVYTKVVSQLPMTFTYAVSSPQSVRIVATAHLDVSVSNNNGLVRTLSLAAPVQFSGDRATASFVLPIAKLLTITTSYASVNRGITGPYPVVVSAVVAGRGKVGGVPLSVHLDQHVKFKLSSTALVPVTAAHSGQTQSTARPTSLTAASPAFNSLVPGSVALARTRANHLFGLGVATLRIIALGVLFAAALVVYLMRRSLSDAWLLIEARRRNGGRDRRTVVEVDELPLGGTVIVIRVSSFEGISEVGRQLECPILHTSDASGDHFAVLDHGTLYDFAAMTGRRQRRSRAEMGDAHRRGTATSREAGTSPARAV